jgi:hypothetical protein
MPTGSGVTILSSTTSTPHYAPVDQPTSVRQITARLFPAYTVDEGTLHLAGCSLEDRLFVRLDFSRNDFRATVHVDREGNEAGDELVDLLGLTETAQTTAPPDFSPHQVARLVESGIQIAQRRWADLGADDLVSTTLLWCRHAEGKLRFTFGERWVDLPFSGWTRPLEAPPFVCPHSGRETFHLAATDDGRVAAVESIEACSQSGRRVLSDDLVTCSVTGRRMLPEFTVTCPVTGLPVFGPEMVACGTCREDVSPAAVEDGECSACREPQPVARTDPRIAQVVTRHPHLARWGKWRISETATVRILVGLSWAKRRLVVVDKNSVEVKLTATAGRWSGHWVRDP